MNMKRCLSLLPTYNLLLSSLVFVNSLQQKQRFYHVRLFTLHWQGRRPYFLPFGRATYCRWHSNRTAVGLVVVRATSGA